MQTFPERLIPLDKKVEVKTPKPLGVTAKVFVQEVARKLSEYNQEIECNAYGEDIGSKKIAINSVGRWLFGVPGFQAHVRIVPVDHKVFLYYPKKSPESVHQLIATLKGEIEKG